MRRTVPRRRVADFRKSAARVELEATRALYVGPPIGAGWHRSAVTCVALALDGTLEVAVAAGGARRRAISGAGVPVTSACIPAEARHRIDAAARRVAFLYLDPADVLAIELEELRRLVARGEGLAALPPVAPARVDPRCARVLAELRRGRWLNAPVATVADAVGLSPSRFMHVFRTAAGVPFRRYRRWARLLYAVRRAGAGASWTTAAGESWFASSSHLSDAFRDMFGIPPSALAAMQVSVSET